MSHLDCRSLSLPRLLFLRPQDFGDRSVFLNRQGGKEPGLAAERLPERGG
jgi:hypothetical protein